MPRPFPAPPHRPGSPRRPGWLIDRVLYRDAMMLIVDKPAGLPVHAGPRGGASLEDHFDALRFGLPRRPALAHRLDRDTSGCLVLGRHRQALARLGRLFAGGEVRKTYWAIVVGAPPAAEGIVDLPLLKQNVARGWWMKVDPGGQPAITDYRTLGAADGLTWLELHPRTGRTHQIRVHCQALGCPVLGDPVYGAPTETLPPLHLHARAIVVPLHPAKPPVEALAEPPQHIRSALRRCGRPEPAAAAGQRITPAAPRTRGKRRPPGDGPPGRE